jgi:hypothetical protein
LNSIAYLINNEKFIEDHGIKSCTSTSYFKNAIWSTSPEKAVIIADTPGFNDSEGREEMIE